MALDEFNASGGEGSIIAREIVGGEEQEDAAAGLVADRGRLFGGSGAGWKDRGGKLGYAGRADRAPAFVLLGLRRVLDQREAALAHIKGEPSS